jgi:hypothetical protein
VNGCEWRLRGIAFVIYLPLDDLQKAEEFRKELCLQVFVEDCSRGQLLGEHNGANAHEDCACIYHMIGSK